ncbi:Asp23/Gls24 family envelope stress response protein [Shouchella clausii]|uniref:Asp23/Gls24 family envelope stress response protein n=1 Tax=Shouchella clausii TaxID=79880 RepID=UPI000BA5972F|nr:Asp23/Gls24 family envelope stress response protein [Shouchella clausii]PAD40906.1 Asp23/Gls24 family envelope stress response protein [Bacillus sp. 7520-S]MBU8594803.1 Asp23/Gls24 family envelope stress response protein [Shouchella clausii]MCY1106196.1 Asp23/Gls24 family envelope stress response protein [Shouchella clausii]MED4160750.1 Asp23/Gls24 family envelope stress response protein [Shouchella clausii]MED4176631.1 Asp23/Gls24 family envelope stress response protein [Shouchella clausii
MEDHQLLELDEQKGGLGKVEISPEVIEVIAGIATQEVEGVAALRGNFAADVAERLGRKNHGKGVKVELTEEGIIVDVSIIISYGAAVPEVAKLIQLNIQQALETMTAIRLNEINVHVVGVYFESTEAQNSVDNDYE